MRAASNERTSKCHASYHMRLQEYALWELCMRLTSGGRNRLYFDGRRMAARFSQCSKSAIYNHRDSLIQKGWLEPLNLGVDGKTPRKTNGQCSATQLRVLAHDQWTETHGTEQCCPSSPLDKSSPAEWTGPVQKIQSASPEIDQNPVQPGGHSFVPGGHSFVKEISLKESSVKIQTTAHRFALPDWIPQDVWNGFGESRKCFRKPLTDQASELIVRKLDQFRSMGHDPRKVLEQSIERGWAGVFPVAQSDLKSSRHAGLADVDYTKGTDGFVVARGAQ